MARISTYGQDSTLNKLDKVLGTDSATGATKNYTIDSMIGLVNSEDLVNVFDGVSYSFKSYEAGSSSPRGIINLNAGAASNAAFGFINQIYISVLDKHGNSIANYLDDTLNSFIRIVQKTNIDTYGVLEVTAVADHDGGAYKLLTVTPRVNNGNIIVNEEYFVSNYSAVFDQDFSDDSVTEFGDVTDAGSGLIITSAERTSLNNFTANGLVHNDVVDNVTTTDTTLPLSANQGKILKGLIDSINTLLTSDNVDLDSLQEVVDYIEANRSTLDSLGISNISGLQAALDAKQNTEVGKGLSTEDFTSALLTKLNGIAAQAEVNVQSNWNEANTGSDAFIQNKPGDLTNLSIHNVAELSDVNTAGSGNIITSPERTKLTGIAAGAEVNVQSNWNETDSNSDAFIQNKPALAPSGAEANVQSDFNETDTGSDAFILNKPDLTLKADKATTIEVAGTANEVEVSPSGAQDLSASRTFTVGLPNNVTVTNDLTVGDTIELTNAQGSTPTFDNGFYHILEDTADTLHFRYGGKDVSIDYFTEILPTGILNGGELTKANNTQFTIAAGDGIINDLNKTAGSDPHPEIKKINWSQQTITVFNLDSNETNQLNAWIYVDVNGVVQQQATAFTDAQKRSNIVIGSAIHTEGVLKFVRTFPVTAYNSNSQLTEFANIFGPLKKSGHKVSANGANLSIDRAAGVAFALGRNYVADPENPSTVSDSAQAQSTIHRYYRDGSGGFVLDDGVAGAGYTTLDPTKYDDGTGTLATVSGGHYSVQRLYYFPGTPSIIISYYGHDDYNSLDEAEKNYIFEDFIENENTVQQAIYLGAVIMSGGATALNNSSQAKFLTAGSFRGLASVNLGGVAASAALGDLADVNIQSVANKQVIQYNSSTSQFENVTDLDLGGNKVLFGNLYANESDLPSASTYHGMFAHVHATGKGYFAHGGAWRKLLDETSSTTDDLTEGSTNEYFTNAKADARADLRIAAASIGDLSNVDLTGIANDKILKYNSATSQFEPVDDSGGDTYTLSASQDGSNVDILLDAGSGTDSTLQLTAGSNITLTRDSAQAVTIASTGGGASSVTRNTASGDGSTVNFTLSQSITDENNTFVYIDGVYQSKLGYSVSGSTLTFSTAPPTGTDNIEVISYASIAAQDASNIVRDEFVGNGTQTAFTLSAEPRSIDATWVFLQGVFQEKTHYSISGTTLTFDTAPQNTFSVEVISITGVINVANLGQVQNDTFTGNGTQTAYTLSLAPANTASCNVFINGVYQEKSTYSLAGTTLTFTTAPSNGDSIEVESKKTILPSGVSYASMASDTFTGNGSTTSFALTNGSPQSEEYTIVHLNGVYQNKSTYSLSGSNIVFVTAPSNGDSIEIVSISSVNAQSVPGVTSVNGQTGAVTVASTMGVNVINSSTTATANNLYVFTANLTLTLPASPSAGDSIKISNRSGVATCVLARNGSNIMGSASDLTLDTASASFELIYSDATNGWVIIGQ